MEISSVDRSLKVSSDTNRFNSDVEYSQNMNLRFLLDVLSERNAAAEEQIRDLENEIDRLDFFYRSEV